MRQFTHAWHRVRLKDGSWEVELASPKPETKYSWSPRGVGSVLGGASAVTVFVLLAFRSQRFADLADSSLSLTGLAILVFLVATGTIVGRIMAVWNLVPPLKPLLTVALALLFAFGPLCAGFTQVALREPALPLPKDAQSIQWDRKPWGKITLIFESATEAQELHEQLVLAAKQDGWLCRKCRFQAVTGTGRANFAVAEPKTNGAQGYLEFEITSGGEALEGLHPSNLTKVRISSERGTLSVEWFALFVSALIVFGLLFRIHQVFRAGDKNAA